MAGGFGANEALYPTPTASAPASLPLLAAGELWWLETGVQRHCRGEACLIRSADEFVGAVADQAEAERFDHVLGPWLEECGRARSGAQTRIIPFSRPRHAGICAGAVG